MNREHRSHTSSLALRRTGYAVAGIALAAYPALRPYSDERSMEAARAWSSPLWLAAHLLAVLAFGALALALRHEAWPGRQTPDRAHARMQLALLGLLPYYGMETFGLHALGLRALETGDTAYVELGDAMRMGPVQVTVFGLGLVFLALVGGRLIQGHWSQAGRVRWGGVLAGLGLLLFLPQFYTPAPLRMVHGLLTGVGLLLLAFQERPVGQDALHDDGPRASSSRTRELSSR